MVNGKISSSRVGVRDGVNVIVGTGEGVIVSMITSGAGKVAEGSIGGEGWHAAIIIITSEAVL
jgi:hypothetical protein